MDIDRVKNRLRETWALAARRKATEAVGLSVSAWIPHAVRRRLASRGLRRVVAEWEAQHGSLTEEELSAARRRLEA